MAQKLRANNRLTVYLNSKKATKILLSKMQMTSVQFCFGDFGTPVQLTFQSLLRALNLSFIRSIMVPSPQS